MSCPVDQATAGCGEHDAEDDSQSFQHRIPLQIGSKGQGATTTVTADDGSGGQANQTFMVSLGAAAAQPEAEQPPDQRPDVDAAGSESEEEHDDPELDSNE